MAVLAVHELGSPAGPPVLAIHGVTGHGLRYRRLAAEGLPGHRIVAVDLRGHGGSTGDGPYSAERHVADLVETLDALGLDRVPVIGHSFGGFLGLRLLAAAPDRVERLAMIDPAMLLPGPLAAERCEGTITDPGWASPDEARAARRAGRDASQWPDVDQDLEDNLHLAADGRYRFRFRRGAVVTAWSEMATPLPALPGDQPVLLVPALREIYVTDEVRAALAERLGGRLEVHDVDCGHMVYWEAFDELAGALRGFLAG